MSHATHGVLLPFTSIIGDLGTELCTFSAKLNAQYTKPLVQTPVINDTLQHLPKQFTWENEAPPKLRATLQTEYIKAIINEFLDDTVPSENVITSLDAVETIFTTTAKRCLKMKSTTKRRRKEISFNEK